MGKHSSTGNPQKWRVRAISFIGIHIGWGAIEPGVISAAAARRFDTWEEAFAYASERAANRVVLDRARSEGI